MVILQPRLYKVPWYISITSPNDVSVESFFFFFLLLSRGLFSSQPRPFYEQSLFPNHPSSNDPEAFVIEAIHVFWAQL